MRANRKMKELLDESSRAGNLRAQIALHDLHQLLFPPIHEIDGCIIIDGGRKETICVSRLKYIEKHIEEYGKTLSEDAFNEVLVNACLVTRNREALLKVGLMVVSVWSDMLGRRFPHLRFCIPMSYDGTNLIMRFFTIREGETSIYDLVESYDEAFMLVEVG